MSRILITLINMSITASVLAIALLLLKTVFKRLPRFVSVILWAFVAVRLVLPFNFESELSLIPSGETLPQSITDTAVPQINSNLPFIDTAVDSVLAENFTHGSAEGATPMQRVFEIASVVWLCGVAVMLLYWICSVIRIKHRLRESVPLYTKKERIYICDRIPSPFIFGIIRPKIYMPSGITPSDAECVIAHERAHISRRDYIWKPLAFLLLSVYWFNPILWVAYIYFCRDIELATDEKVIKSNGEEIKIQYSHALLNCSGDRRFITACPTAFGENAVKDRIKNVLNYKKPAFWVAAISLIAVVLVPVFFLTDPKPDTFDEMPTVAGEGEFFLDTIVIDVESGYMLVRNIVFAPLSDAEDGIYRIPLKTQKGSIPEIKIGGKVRVVHTGDWDTTERIPRLKEIVSLHTFGTLPPETHSPISDFEYRNNYYGGKSIIKYTGNDENVVIPTVIEGKAVIQISGTAFESNMNIKSVYIPDTVYQISGSAFENCMNLESVHMPIALYGIGDGAFANCKSLKEIELPNTLQRIGNAAFEKCYGLKYVKIPKSIKYWGGKSFAKSGLKEAEFEEGLAEIGSSDFQECLWLEKVTIPEGTEWSFWCFYGCGALPKEYREPPKDE
ncbi:MAG: leucine-rich repeat protein [Clostridia bacterium]|nr:leucine-rich repeat protein [Clostridia bacterium]